MKQRSCTVGCNSQKSPAFKDSFLCGICMFNLSLLLSNLPKSVSLVLR